MDNKSIAKHFELLAQLMELHGQNTFRARATASAANRIGKLPDPLTNADEESIRKIPNISESTARKIKTILDTGQLPELEELKALTPPGILEMLSVRGLGPKKIITLWKDLGLETIGEVYYACNENRLINAKGFGAKTQEQVRKAIEFWYSNRGWFRFASLEAEATAIREFLTKQLGKDQKIEFTGDYRRKSPILQSIDVLVTGNIDEVKQLLSGHSDLTIKEPAAKVAPIHAVTEQGFPVRIFVCDTEHFARNWMLTTGSDAHLQELPSIPTLASETAIYTKFGMAFIEPELREGRKELDWAKVNNMPKLITFSDLKGSLHNHSTYSDGVNTLEEMANYCKNELQLDYLGISDHSRSAFYANGLSIERVMEQWEEIDQLNKKLAPFRIFKGIESDILNDGTLDYPDELLRGFDFIVASIHSNLHMDQEKATQRLIKAIENPYTTMLGHPTGRLLLSREGYPVDHKKIIDACAANQVVIEINANPQRLDIDWTWHSYAIEKGVMLSINPDAHRTTGLRDMHYGVYAARKGGVQAEDCLNTLSKEAIESYFIQRKQKA